MLLSVVPLSLGLTLLSASLGRTRHLCVCGGPNKKENYRQDKNKENDGKKGSCKRRHSIQFLPSGEGGKDKIRLGQASMYGMGCSFYRVIKRGILKSHSKAEGSVQ